MSYLDDKEGRAVESSEYEFNQKQNELLQDLAKKMNFVAILAIAGGILGILAGMIALFTASANAFGTLIQGIFLLLIGLWTRNAAIAFKRVVNTTGRDVENLMAALRELRKLYTLQYWLAIVILVLLAIALVATVIAR